MLCIFLVRPLDVRIIDNKSHLSAGKTVTMECESTGSRPPAIISWWEGSEKLMTDNEVISDNGNLTLSTLSLVPTPEDHAKKFTCSAQNPSLPDSRIEDYRVVTVHCKYFLYGSDSIFSACVFFSFSSTWWKRLIPVTVSYVCRFYSQANENVLSFLAFFFNFWPCFSYYCIPYICPILISKIQHVFLGKHTISLTCLSPWDCCVVTHNKSTKDILLLFYHFRYSRTAIDTGGQHQAHIHQRRQRRLFRLQH